MIIIRKEGEGFLKLKEGEGEVKSKNRREYSATLVKILRAISIDRSTPILTIILFPRWLEIFAIAGFSGERERERGLGANNKRQ